MAAASWQQQQQGGSSSSSSSSSSRQGSRGDRDAGGWGVCLELVNNVAELGHHLALEGQDLHGLAGGVRLPELG